MPRTVGDGSPSNLRRYVRKKRSSAEKSRYVLKERQAANDWACIPQSRRVIDEPDLVKREVEQPFRTRRSAHIRDLHQDYDQEDYYYEPDYEPDDEYEPDDIPRRSRSVPARRYRPADILNLRAITAAVVVILAAVICGMAAESRFGVLSALITGLASSAAAVAGWLATVSPVTLAGGAVIILIGAWMIAKAVRLKRTYYDEPAPRRRVLVSKETLDRYF